MKNILIILGILGFFVMGSWFAIYLNTTIANEISLNIEKCRLYVEKNSIGIYAGSFKISWNDAQGLWTASINTGFPKGEKIGIEIVKGVGETWHEAVNELAPKCK